MTDKDGTHLSKKYTVEFYNGLGLDLADIDQADWNRAIDILEARISERYIEPIDLLLTIEKTLITEDKNKKFGFVILSIDCLLLEAIQCFYEGKLDEYCRMKGAEYFSSSKLFKTFLRDRQEFTDYFSTAKANLFFEDIRCSLLHSGQTSHGVKVLSATDRGLIDGSSKKITTIYRTVFHQKLCDEFQLYLNKLKCLVKNRKDNDDALLAKFLAKMDFIAYGFDKKRNHIRVKQQRLCDNCETQI